MSFIDRLFGLSEEEREKLRAELTDSFRGAIKELSPDKRYIFILRTDAATEEDDADELRELLTNALDLEGSNLKIAIVAGEVKLLEF